MRVFLTLWALMFIQGCTVAYYKTEGNLDVHDRGIVSKPCKINYSLEVHAERRQLTTGTHEMNEWADKAKARYQASTNKVILDRGCSPNYVDNKENANLNIGIKISPYHSALPQEWLTGLSFGLIPSWGTRKNEYTYTFTNIIKSTSHSYSVDNVSFNHLILFPVFWVTFFTLDESRAFEEALENFVENS